MIYIDGAWRGAADGATFAVTNPASGEHIADVADGTAADIEAAIAAADGAFDEWAGLTAYQRSGYLQDAHRLMMERQAALAKVMTEEQGKPLRTASNEIQYAAEFFLWFAEEAKRVYGELIPAPRADQRLMVIH